MPEQAIRDGLYELMRTQRAVRRLRPDPIPGEVLKRIMQAATWVPTGGNQQPWRMIIVTDRDKKKRLGELYKAQWELFVTSYRQRFVDAPQERREKEERTIAAGNHLAGNFGALPFGLSMTRVFSRSQLKIADRCVSLRLRPRSTV